MQSAWLPDLTKCNAALVVAPCAKVFWADIRRRYSVYTGYSPGMDEIYNTTVKTSIYVTEPGSKSNF